MKHQLKAGRFLRVRNGCACLFMAPGTGKTMSAIRYGERHLPALVVCRRDDYLTWRDELALDGHDWSTVRAVESGKSARAMGEEAWTLVTYDLMRQSQVSNAVRRTMFETVIADESHCIKRWAAERTKAVIKATRHIPRRIAMTGTPITNEPLDVFSQCLFVDNGRLFDDNEWRFKNRYYIQSGPGWFLKRDSKKRISRRLRQIAYSVHEDEVLDLPPMRSVVKAVPPTSGQLRAMERVLDQWEVRLQGGKTVEIDQVVVQLAKLRQIASGFVYDEEGRPRRMRSPKLKLLFRMLKDVDELGRKRKIVVWCAHTAEIERIGETAAKSGVSAVLFHGSHAAKKREARLRFRDDPSVRLFVGQVDAGVGMNELAVADTAVYFSNSHKIVSRQQSMRRTRRKGSERHAEICYYDLVVEGTVDETILSAIKQKMSLAKLIVHGLRDGRSLASMTKGAA
jgi:SNF2 family DNA or RNA helicase